MTVMKKTNTTTEKESPNKKDDSGKSEQTPSGETPATTTIDLGFLEEDDDFEEFPAETYDTDPNDIEAVNIWEDDWDDDNIEDDFSVLLKEEFQKRSLGRGARRTSIGNGATQKPAS